MGNCMPPQRSRPSNMFVAESPNFKQILALFERHEIDLLKLIYKDLASRQKDDEITKECFSDFFNMIGLWAERVFDNFAKKQNNIIGYEEFVCGIAYYIKCDEQAKIRHLFQLYDLNGEGGITRQDFLQMIMNYPKDDIKSIMNDAMFLENLNILKKNADKNQKIPVKNVYTTERRNIISIRSSPTQINLKKSDMNISKQDIVMDPQNQLYTPGLRPRFSSVDMLFPSESMIAHNGVPIGNFVCQLTVQFQGQTIELQRVNLNYLVQRYVDMVFSQNEKEAKLKLNLEEFTQFVSQHPNIYNGLYKGFNYDVWGYNNQIKQSRFIFLAKDIDGEMMKMNRKSKLLSPRFCELSQHFCLEFSSKSSRLPNKIICLDGLSVREIIIRHDKKFGFEIFHKDKVYKSKTYFCKDEEAFHIWRERLQIFEKADIKDHYTLFNVIGEGRFSVVHKGINKKDHDEYAVKVIEKFKLSRDERLMLSHETEIMKLLNHSCIIKFKENIENKTHLYIITELVDDGDLFDFIQKKRLVSGYKHDAALIMAQLFDTIQYLHTIGIVHKDLKPENIMIVYQPDKKQIKQVKIIDFGFSNFMANIQDHNEQQASICGTPNFMAPEVLAGKIFDFKIDNFALGVIMFKMLSGVLPFDSQYPDEIFSNILEGKYEFDDDIWCELSQESMDLVQKLLQKEPNDRIHLSEAMNHPWIQNRSSYKPETRKIIKSRQIIF